MNYLKLIIKRNNLNLVYIFKNYLSIFWLFLFLLFGWASACVFIPLQYNSNQIMIVSLYLLLILGSLSYDWSNSILKNNEIISGTDRDVHYLSLFLTIFIIGNLGSFLLIIGNVILNELGLLLKDWGFLSNPQKFNLYWNQISWFALFYAININILLTFAFYFFVWRLFSNKKSYFSFVASISIFMLIFGASFNSYFWCSHYNEETVAGSFQNISYTFVPGTSLFPKWMFLPTAILFPFYSVFQFFGIVVNNTLSNNYSHLSIHHDCYIPFFIQFNNSVQWQWSLVVIMPFIHIALFSSLGIITSKLKSFRK